jgi:Zn-dependent protease with chaperone function
MDKGSGIFFDGLTSARQEVSVALTPETLLIVDPRSDPLAEWPYVEVEQYPAPKHILRLGLRQRTETARLEIHDPAFAAAVDDRALTVDRTGGIDRRARSRVVVWSLVATASLIVMAVVGVPELAARIAPLIPASVERRLGTAVDAQVRASLDTHKLGNRLECGTQGAERIGQAALDALVAPLARAAALDLPLRVSVIRRTEANAITLPGGHIYVFQGLLDKAERPDELAGVIAHEIGHVAHRDNTRAMLQNAGLSLLFGMLLGDFVGGGAVVVAARTLIQTSYSRDVERAADAFGARLVAQVGGDAAALGTILTRIDRTRKPGVRIWLDHPDAEDRVRAINAMGPSRPSSALIDAGQWAALKRICAEP